MSNAVHDEKESGGCLCGHIRFEATGKPRWIAYCHCHSCRRNTGAAVAAFIGFEQGQVEFTGGERRTFESSPGVRRSFCSTCGNPISYEADWCADEIHIYISTMDHPESFEPARHVFFDEHVEWFDVHDDLPRFGTTSRQKEPMSWGPKRKG